MEIIKVTLNLSFFLLLWLGLRSRIYPWTQYPNTVRSWAIVRSPFWEVQGIFRGLSPSRWTITNCSPCIAHEQKVWSPTSESTWEKGFWIFSQLITKTCRHGFVTSRAPDSGRLCWLSPPDRPGTKKGNKSRIKWKPETGFARIFELTRTPAGKSRNPKP